MYPDIHKDVDEGVFEHGRHWAVCRTCGAQWAIDDTNNGPDYEQVSEGDGYCEENAE